MTQQTLAGQGLITIEASRSDSNTPHSVGLLWAGDQPDAETSTRKHTTLTTGIQTPPLPRGIRTRNPGKPAAADARLRPRSHWDRHKLSIMRPKFSYQSVKKLVLYMSANTDKTVNILVLGDDAVCYGRCVQPPWWRRQQLPLICPPHLPFSTASHAGRQQFS